MAQATALSVFVNPFLAYWAVAYWARTFSLGGKITNAVTSLFGAGATFEKHFVPTWEIPFQKATTQAKIAGLDFRFAHEAGDAPTATNVTLGGG